MAIKRVVIILGLVIAAVAVVAAFWSAVDTIPPQTLTLTRMHGVKRRIVAYAQTHGQAPPDLRCLPERPGYDNCINDAWGRPLLYEVDPAGVVTLRSLGRDGVAGGAGEDADLTGRFRLHGPDGQWVDESVAWSDDPRKR